MRTVIIGLLAAILAAAFGPAAFAAAKPPPVDPAMKSKGMAAAPSVVQAAGIDCQVVDARQMGEGTDPKTKVKSTYYELACKDAEGFVIGIHSGGAAPTPPDIFTCLEAAASSGSGAGCTLPENADPAVGLAGLVAKVNSSCQVAKARGIGHNATQTVFEVACQDGDGYDVATSFPISAAKPVTLTPCMAIDSGNLKCQFTDQAAENAAVDRLAAKSGKPCTVTGRRWVGIAVSNDLYYEVACKEGKGYILDQTPNGALAQAVDCASTDQCTLTDTRAAQSEQASLYTKLARKAGFACDVAKYAPFPVDVPNHEVVELSCSNRPDGAVGVFPASESEPAKIYDCAHSELKTYRCSFTKPEDSVASLTADLKKLNRQTCSVSNFRFVGVADTHGYMEVACADGLPGYTIEYSLEPIAPTQAFPCTGAPPVEKTCQLPTNMKKG